MAVSMFKAPLRWLSATVRSRHAGPFEVVLTRQDAMWLVGCLTSALRRPKPPMYFAKEVGQGERRSAALDARFKSRAATVDELRE